MVIHISENSSQSTHSLVHLRSSVLIFYSLDNVAPRFAFLSAGGRPLGKFFFILYCSELHFGLIYVDFLWRVNCLKNGKVQGRQENEVEVLQCFTSSIEKVSIWLNYYFRF